ncbi:hypothetical protein [Halorubrum kocurii]|uniref:hypothetical protein n=1 Tax=Halorubrum kocurii TaxID=478441 RepID=UPI0019D3A568|nr:hypothetical protein [Halorubrum kocurii]
MELTPEHLQSENLDPLPLFQSEEATLWHIDTTHPDVVADDHVNASSPQPRSDHSTRIGHTPCSCSGRRWSDEAIPELLRYLATHLHGSGTAVTETFSVEVFTATAVRSPAGRTVWWREDYVNDAAR